MIHMIVVCTHLTHIHRCHSSSYDSKALKEFHVDHRILLTNTPNKVINVFSLEFICKGFLLFKQSNKAISKSMFRQFMENNLLLTENRMHELNSIGRCKFQTTINSTFIRIPNTNLVSPACVNVKISVLTNSARI